MSVPAGIIRVPVPALRFNAPRLSPEIRPMPASRAQAADIRRGLRSIIRWAKSPGSKASKIDRERVLLDALEAALREIESAPNSLAAWIIGAMFASLHKAGAGDAGRMWVVRDRKLFDEACDALEFLHQRQQPPTK